MQFAPVEMLSEKLSGQALGDHVRERIGRCGDLLRSILESPTPRCISGTLEPLNQLLLVLWNCWNVVALLRSVHPDAAVRSAAEESEQELARFSSDLWLNRSLYEAVRAVDISGADPETARLVEHVLRDFHRAGVDREDSVRVKVHALREELVTLGQEFLRNIALDVRAIALDGPEELDGLPPDYVRARPPGPDGKIRITTDYPDYNPFMTYARSSLRRRQLYSEFRRRAYPANLDVLHRLLLRRHELATLLGYSTWAEYATEENMSRSARTVADFIDKVSTVAKEQATREYQMLLDAKRKQQPSATSVSDWEKGYYEEIARIERFRVDSKELRGYFSYTRVKEGVLALTEGLFGIQFVPAPSVPTWHPDVEVYDVHEDGKLIGRTYLDMHPREGKFKHAAMFPLTRGARGLCLPEAVLVANFAKPGPSDAPTLIEHDDVVTLFHEFGHVLHHLLASESRWVKFSGTATEWDFVEVPSQLYEEWAWDHEVLRRFALHHVTRQPVPRELVEAMREARRFGRALGVRHQMFYAALSLRCHSDDPLGMDTSQLVEEIQNQYSCFEFVGDTYFQASFGHLDNYSALYYTYMWCLVIEKDIFGEFKKRGLLDRAIANRYREKILAPGGARDAADLVRDFLGRDYSFDAFARWLAEGR